MFTENCTQLICVNSIIQYTSQNKIHITSMLINGHPLANDLLAYLTQGRLAGQKSWNCIQCSISKAPSLSIIWLGFDTENTAARQHSKNKTIQNDENRFKCAVMTSVFFIVSTVKLELTPTVYFLQCYSSNWNSNWY